MPFIPALGEWISLSLRPGWFTSRIPGQLRLSSKNKSLKKKNYLACELKNKQTRNPNTAPAPVGSTARDPFLPSFQPEPSWTRVAIPKTRRHLLKGERPFSLSLLSLSPHVCFQSEETFKNALTSKLLPGMK